MPALPADKWDTEGDPLAHWRSLVRRDYQATPCDVRMLFVRHVFAVPGSSAGLERAFSHAGRAITTRRAHLKGSRAAATIFLHENDLLGRFSWCKTCRP